MDAAAGSSNYYERAPRGRHEPTSGRYPRNHVSYSPLLKPIEWLDTVGRGLGARPFATAPAVLRAYDRAGELADLTGTPEELARLRGTIAVIAEGLDANPYISPIGRFLLRKLASGFLRQRRHVLTYYRDHRAFIEANGRFAAPVIITGLPRSGTTLLHRLMSEDPDTRAPYTYEMEAPVPPLGAEADPLADPRIGESGAGLAVIKRLAPGFLEKLSESHHWSATDREESLIYMLAHHGLSVMSAPAAGEQAMAALLACHDKRPVLRYERLFFTMLDAYRPARSHWTLKAPNYALCFPLVFEEYPDARVVLTHRNPLVTLPSLCRLLESWNIALDRDGSFDKLAFGRVVKPLVEACLMVPLTYRQTHPEHESQIFDCQYEDLFQDPIAMVRRVYAHFGLDVTRQFEERMATYLANNQQGKYGRHRYSLEEYGFDAEALDREFEPYMIRYGFSIPVRTGAAKPASLGEVNAAAEGSRRAGPGRAARALP